MIWIWFLFCGALVFFFLSLPYWSSFFYPPSALAEQKKRVAVHREMVQRLQQETAQGLMAADDASLLSDEAARRLLQGNERDWSQASSRKRALVVSVAAAVAILTLAGVAYLKMGQPNRTQPRDAAPDLLSAPAVDGGPSTGELIAKLDQHLKKNPRDPQGWVLLGDTYGNVGKFADAADAYGRALELNLSLDVQTELYARRAEAFVLMSEGLVTETAKFDIARALAIDPSHPVARYYQGLAFFQSGRSAAGLETWSKLYEDLPADLAWRDQLQGEIEFAKALMKFDNE